MEKITEEIQALIKEYFEKRDVISKEQDKFLRENRGILFEYYEQVSNPRGDSNILGNLEVWVYGNDRQDFTPHCHVMLHDKSIEVEISIIDWNIINVKNGDFSSKMYKSFKKWLNTENTRFGTITNKQALYAIWDGNNPNNDLLGFVAKHNIDLEDDSLKKYIRKQLELISKEKKKYLSI